MVQRLRRTPPGCASAGKAREGAVETLAIRAAEIEKRIAASRKIQRKNFQDSFHCFCVSTWLLSGRVTVPGKITAEDRGKAHGSDVTGTGER